MSALLHEYRPDAYGHVVNEQGVRARRHPKCKCEVPCQLRFACESPDHRGSKGTPYCNGAADGLEWCDTCWAREYA